MEKREVKTSWKELLRAFFSSDDQLEEKENKEKSEFDKENSKILAQAKRNIASLEQMVTPPSDEPKAKKQGRRQTREQTRARTKTLAMQDKEQTVREEDKELER